MTRQHPRRRPGLFVLGGQALTPEAAAAELAQDDFLSDPPAGGPLESSAAGNLPVTQEPACQWAHGVVVTGLDHRGLCPVCADDEEESPVPEELARIQATAKAWLADVAAGSEPVAAAVDWDQAAAVEPYQLDVTRSLDDTTRMGNSLSAAVRLELLLGTMREEAQDRPGPGWPADVPTDPVDGAELDPVDGLPVGDDGDQLDDGDDYAEALAALESHAAVAFLPGWEEQARASLDDAVAGARLTFAAPAPVADRPSPEEYLEDRLGPVVPLAAEPATTTRGVQARILNWTSRHDDRSLEFGVRAKLRAPAPLVDRLWAHGPIMDQGTAPPLSLHDASGCTGHAAANAANILTLAHRTGPGDLAAPLDSGDAMRLYERAQELDEVPGEAYPGTSILAVMKAGQDAGLWASYLWAFGTRDIAQALLQVGPVVVGIPWLSAMAEPGPDGIVTVAGDSLGGHALCLFAIRMAVAGRAGPWFGALQTWGEDIGDHGVIWFHHRDLAQLLHGRGEAAIPVVAE